MVNSDLVMTRMLLKYCRTRTLAIIGTEDNEEGLIWGLGISNLHFSDWFKPSKNVSLPIHPLCEDEAVTSMNYAIGYRLYT